MVGSKSQVAAALLVCIRVSEWVRVKPVLLRTLQSNLSGLCTTPLQPAVHVEVW